MNKSIKLFKKPTDSDLKVTDEVCYKDIDGQFTKTGTITDVETLDGIKNYHIEGARGIYPADELRLVENQ